MGSFGRPLRQGVSPIRGRVRTYGIDQHLRTHLPQPPAAIADVGGGAGTQSIPLARRGYQVTIVDPSLAMVERASMTLAKEADEVVRRVQLVEVSGEYVSERLGRDTFDTALRARTVGQVRSRIGGRNETRR
ncbi:MAG: class I SAM-dependent methyltransferase [Acidimicrobiia bacterium]